MLTCLDCGTRHTDGAATSCRPCMLRRIAASEWGRAELALRPWLTHDAAAGVVAPPVRRAGWFRRVFGR